VVQMFHVLCDDENWWFLTCKFAVSNTDRICLVPLSHLCFVAENCALINIMGRLNLFAATLALLLPTVAPFLTPVLPKQGLHFHHHTAGDRRTTLLPSNLRSRTLLQHINPSNSAAASSLARKTRNVQCFASLASFDEAPQWQKLVEWIRSSGGWVSNTIAAGSYSGKERGLYAISPTQGAVAFVPAKCLLRVSNDPQAPAPEMALLGDQKLNANLETRLALRLLMVMRDQTLGFSAYVQSVPPRVSPITIRAHMCP
jgi:hypothetical protein